MRLSGLKVIALDFDGTLVESNHIKDQAFETIFSEWPEHKETMMKWHRSRNNVDRREKFFYFVEKILDHQSQEKLIDQLTSKFSELTSQAIVDCPMVAGVQTFLKKSADKCPLFLISATPQNELNEILQKRDLIKYFKETYGSPIHKVEILKKIMAEEKVSPEETLYIGDSPEDQQAADSLGIHFIGRQSDRKLNSSMSHVYSDFFGIINHFMSFNGLY